MKLSARTRYAARLLLDLAMSETDNPVKTGLLSENTGITVQFIEQIIRPLKKAGLISSVRGAAGGHYLSKPPDQITLGDVIRTMEGAIHIANCLECKSTCERSVDCRTRSVWERASKAMEDELDSITLADLMNSNSECPSMS